LTAALKHLRIGGLESLFVESNGKDACSLMPTGESCCLETGCNNEVADTILLL